MQSVSRHFVGLRLAVHLFLLYCVILYLETDGIRILRPTCGALPPYTLSHLQTFCFCGEL